MDDYKHLTGLQIILNKKYPPKLMKPHYHLNKITRKLEIHAMEVSEDIYNELKKEYGKYDDTTSQP